MQMVPYLGRQYPYQRTRILDVRLKCVRRKETVMVGRKNERMIHQLNQFMY